MVWEEGGIERRVDLGTPSSQPNPYREATKFPEIGGSWGGEGLLLELLEGTDSEAAVAHIGVRGTLSLHLGGPRTVGALAHSC